ncbi:hypothetical protein F511_30871 [Dorcoceras hygrometricum]|uniref:Uncharacterized protein n=1 Tax=Dorcoceras hygrometricum TaxID=472368 RepID=A0A2Z7A505_9LAMI|nr:hypothetical protein F511_30871 [Dorcoceras hygrometricum]
MCPRIYVGCARGSTSWKGARGRGSNLSSGYLPRTPTRRASLRSDATPGFYKKSSGTARGRFQDLISSRLRKEHSARVPYAPAGLCTCWFIDVSTGLMTYVRRRRFGTSIRCRFIDQSRYLKSIDGLLYLLVTQSKEQYDTVSIMKQELSIRYRFDDLTESAVGIGERPAAGFF